MSISASARHVARWLKASGRKVVFAESCTGGLVSGALTKIAGISSYHCGGVVVYRNETKRAYLDIPAAVLKHPGPVSEQVAELMAVRVLERTPEADMAVSVTGHLGPDAPQDLDGLVFSSFAWKTGPGKRSQARVVTRRLQCGKDESRAKRQQWVIEQVLDLLREELQTAHLQ
jgi:nicotinamide-nucleotide amidase